MQRDVQTFLFVTTPEEALKEEVLKQVRKKRGVRWSCCRKTHAGDHAMVYLTRLGIICYEWRAISDAQSTSSKPWRYFCNVEYVGAFEPPISRKELCNAISQKEWNAPHANMRVRAASTIPGHVVDKIRALGSMRSPPEVEQEFSEKVAASLKLSRSERLERLASFPKYPTKARVTTEVFHRNQHVVAEVLIRAGGRCAACMLPAPFLKAVDGSPYLEAHHKDWLAKGGEDTVENAEALCPNCHRKAHYG